MKTTLQYYVLSLLLLMSGLATAQERTVTGTVTDADDGMPIPGVNVVVVGTSTGTATDLDGNYKVSVPEGASLAYSFIGYTAQTIVVGSQSVINVTLKSDAQALEEVVVTAMGIERTEASLGYAVQEVSGEDIARAKESNIVNSLTGKVAGVQVMGGQNMGGSARIT
ncbi:MAG: carboxypeptidase-like regulatory domain-containing protein, partial [Bacteroidota bacterium]